MARTSDPFCSWFEAMTQEMGRRHTERVKAETAQAQAADEELERFFERLREMGERLMTVIGPRDRRDPGALAEELIQAAGDWSRLDGIRARGDLSPAETVALVYVHNRGLALEMMGNWTARNGD